MGFVSVRVASLRSVSPTTFDLFLELNGKHIVYIRKGDVIEEDRLKKIREKNVKKLLIRDEDEFAYRGFVMQSVDQALDKSCGLTLEARTEIVHGHQEATAEALLEKPENEANYHDAKEAAGKYVEFIMKEDQAVKTVLNMRGDRVDIVQHGVSVATIAVAIAHKIGLKDPKKTQLLVLGCILHDVSHLATKQSVLSPLGALDVKDRIEYMKHPMAGGELVRRSAHFDPAVINIIVQHEELTNGTGYPNKLQEKATDPLAVIASTANDFDRFMTFNKLARAEAVKRFTIERLGLHPLDQINALKSLV